MELETTRNKLQDLETVHHEATSLRQEIERQQNLVQDNVGEEAQGLTRYAYYLVPLSVALGYYLRDWIS